MIGSAALLKVESGIVKGSFLLNFLAAEIVMASAGCGHSMGALALIHERRSFSKCSRCLKNSDPRGGVPPVFTTISESIKVSGHDGMSMENWPRELTISAGEFLLNTSKSSS